jgi:hypothetical chaperone protein
VRIGGTDFDSLLSLKSVMPLLGLGTQLVEKNLPMPNSLYFELASWPTINFTYTFHNERMLLELVAGACEPEKVARLLKVIRARLGHRIAFAVEDAKIELTEIGAASLPLPFVERELAAAVSRSDFNEAIAARTDRLYAIASKCIREAGLKRNAIQTVFFTGGSSRVPAVRNAIARAAPAARIASGSDFLSVALGLTREAQKRFA